jgi:FHS family L-fucose permease-like MFS transporter
MTPLTERRYLGPLALITSLFFLWALGVNLNDILIPHLKKAFRLTDFQSSFIQVAFFGGYFLAAWPAGWLMNRVGYQRGILAGLLICSSGALLFIPAASLLWYGLFLFALFVMACGQSFLEVAANPYVTILGPPESAERRLNLSQSFNSVGAVITPIIGGAFILSNSETADIDSVKIPYVVIAAIFGLVAVMIYMTALPEVHAHEEKLASTRELWKHAHLVQGVIAQFVYVGAQVGVASFVIRFAEFVSPGTPDKVAANYLKLHLLGFMLGRFAGSFAMKYVQPSRMLLGFGFGAAASVAVALLASGPVAVAGVVAAGFFHSIMFPTIFALSIKNLGPLTKSGSSLLVMAIIGGALFPALMGYISDASSIQRAFVVPLICYVYIIYFAARGYRVRQTAGAEPCHATA